MTILLTGFGGSLLTAAGCLLGGVMADRMSRWRAFLGTGLVFGLFAMAAAGAPRTAGVLITIVALYLILAGVLLLWMVARTQAEAMAAPPAEDQSAVVAAAPAAASP